jgi:hypothetical protein
MSIIDLYKKATLTAVIFIINSIAVLAQTAVVTAGGNQTGSGGSVSYSIGQICDQSLVGNGTLTEGVQQPFEIVVTDETEIPGSFSATAYPNPASNEVILMVENTEGTEILISVFDLQGKLVQQKSISGTQTSISLSELTPLPYFVEIRKEDHTKTFKIIKK